MCLFCKKINNFWKRILNPQEAEERNIIAAMEKEAKLDKESSELQDQLCMNKYGMTPDEHYEKSLESRFNPDVLKPEILESYIIEQAFLDQQQEE